MMNSIGEIAQELNSQDDWLLLGHMLPDGDCIGSLLGLALGLKQLGKRVQILQAEPLPNNYLYLQGIELFKPLEQISTDFSGLIYLDCSDLGRIHDSIREWTAGLTVVTINIDHHPTNEIFGHYNYVDPQAAATGEIIAQLLQALNVTLEPEIAEALYAALLMDTGGFLNGNTTSQTLRTAALLLDTGVDVNSARINLFESKNRKEMYLLRLALQHLNFSPDGRIACMLLPYSDLKKIDALELNPEGLINYTRMIEGVEVGVLLREISPGTIKIGLRSKGRVDVAALAQQFGGGGHRQAAGARRPGTLDEVQKTVFDAIEEVI
ncbi:MAG: bifunctional oligoribonuclease/PAP phosphatase NrnA [Syntrophomonadaceae bacterium]